MRHQRPIARAAKSPGAPVRRFLFLCTAGLLLFSCGDFTLFPDGIGPPPGPEPEPGTRECDRPFQGLGLYKESTESLLAPDLERLQRPAAVAVLPQGMSFSFNPEGTTRTATASAGDVLVADLDTHKIYAYLFNTQGALTSREVFPADARTLGGGLALYVEEVELQGEKQRVQLLLYTGTSPAGASNLFLHLVSEAADSANVTKIPQDINGLPGLTTFQGAGPVAVGRDDTRRAVFIADARPPELGGHSVYRISLLIQEGIPVPEGMTLLADGFTDIQDVGFSNQTKAVYLTEFVGSTNHSTVHRVVSALTRSVSVTKSDLTVFVPDQRLTRSTGLALFPTDRTGTTEALLVLSQPRQIALQQFDVLTRDKIEDHLQLANPDLLYVRQDVAYDCTNAAIFMTRRLNQPGVGVIPPGLYYILPAPPNPNE